jgi:hypothetical protein
MARRFLIYDNGDVTLLRIGGIGCNFVRLQSDPFDPTDTKIEYLKRGMCKGINVWLAQNFGESAS